jgi:hypothetical protein
VCRYPARFAGQKLYLSPLRSPAFDAVECFPNFMNEEKNRLFMLYRACAKSHVALRTFVGIEPRKSATLADIRTSIQRQDGGKGFPPYLDFLRKFPVSADMQLNDGADYQRHCLIEVRSPPDHPSPVTSVCDHLNASLPASYP